MNCFDKIEKIDIHTHPSLDLAILQFKGFNQILYKGHATLLKDQTKISQGKFLCRLGFPFPEFNNFQLNAITDDIEWTNIGNSNSPIFPIEGMVTRFLGDQYQGIMGIEMSTPGLRGQSGGPLFDQNGIIYGMQYATGHLHLGFDQSNREIIINGNPTTISNYPFLHVGMCIHINKIKEFKI